MRATGATPRRLGRATLTSLRVRPRARGSLGADVNLQSGRRWRSACRTFGVSNIERGPGATAFLLAADRADVPLMRLLLELGADPFIDESTDNTRPLMAAAGLGTAAPEEEAGTEPEALIATQLLLELGADVNAVNNEGDTAMHGAAYGSFPTVVQFLADHGADIHVWKHKNEQGRTPLFIAEGYRGGLPRPSRSTIEALVSLMEGAGVPTEGERPPVVDIYAPEPPQKPKP